MLLAFLKNRKCPFSVEITDGRRRSVSQNKLQRLWLLEIAEQLGDQTPEEVRGYCKLTLGVPILRAENDEFREKYDAVLKALSYQSKVAIMMEPLNLPVTRVMTVDQKSRYLDGIHRHFSEQGLALTDPTM
jgi:hypothetical protein